MKERKFVSRVKDLFESVSVEEKVSGKMIAMLAVILLALIMVVFGITTFVHNIVDKDIQKSVETNNVPDVMPPVTTLPVSETEPVTEPTVTSVSEYVLNATEINQSEFEQVIEAEELPLSEKLAVSNIRAGFSGTGYVTGFSAGGENNLEFTFDVPSAQHYDISVCFASDTAVKNDIYLNGQPLFDFQCTDTTTGKFVIKTYYGVFLEQGQNIFAVHETDGAVDFDYIKLKNNQSIYSSVTDIEPVLINGEASPEAVGLMKYLADNFGKRIITGQYVSNTENIEINKIYENTSQHPAIRFGDLLSYSLNSSVKTDPENDEISAGIKWAEEGGIVGYIWHWKAPVYESEFYSDKTQFNLQNAVTDIDIALMSHEEIETLFNDGIITAETFTLVNDIDNVSSHLGRLRDLNIPVLWRPLHEAGGDWFWWGSCGPEAYKWLWELLYRRQTEYHHLNNLIWIWSAQGKDYFVGNDRFDIAAVDLYDENADNTSYYKQYQWLYSLTGGQKLIALSECGRLPDMELTFRDRAVWSFFGLWYGDYILDRNGEISELYNSRETLLRMYNSNRTVTLEKYKNKSELKEEPVVTTAPEAEETEDVPAVADGADAADAEAE